MEKEKEAPKPLTFKVEFHTPDFMASNIATNIIVQRYDKDNFKVSFFEIKPDVILSDEDRERMEKRGTIRADCVGNFIISPQNLETFINVMNEQLSKFKKSMSEELL